MKSVAAILAMLSSAVALGHSGSPPCFKRNDAERAKPNPTLHL